MYNPCSISNEELNRWKFLVETALGKQLNFDNSPLPGQMVLARTDNCYTNQIDYQIVSAPAGLKGQKPGAVAWGFDQDPLMYGLIAVIVEPSRRKLKRHPDDKSRRRLS